MYATEFASVGGQGFAVAPFAHAPEEPPPVPPVLVLPALAPPLPPELVPPELVPPVSIPPAPAWAVEPPLVSVPPVDVELLTPPLAACVPPVVAAVPAVGLPEPPLVLEPPAPVPALEVEPAEPAPVGSVVLEHATTNAAPAPTRKPAVIQSFSLLCIVVFQEGAQLAATYPCESRPRSIKEFQAPAKRRRPSVSRLRLPCDQCAVFEEAVTIC